MILNPIRSIFIDMCSKSETSFDDKRNIHDVKSKACKGKKKLCKLVKIFSFLPDLLSHPVLALYVAMQWKMVCKFFYLNTVLFMLFLSVYFFFIVGIFYHEDKEEWCNLKADKLRHILTCQNWNCPTLFSRWDDGFLVCEILLMMTTTILTLREIIQLISRRVFKK